MGSAHLPISHILPINSVSFTCSFTCCLSYTKNSVRGSEYSKENMVWSLTDHQHKSISNKLNGLLNALFHSIVITNFRYFLKITWLLIYKMSHNNTV